MAESPIALPEFLKKGYTPDSEYYVFRQPFLINASITSRAPGESDPGITKFESTISNQQVASNDLFVGIAGLKALDVLSMVGKSSGQGYQHAVMFDVNERHLEGMREVLRLIKECETPQEFIEKFAPLQEELLNPPKPGALGFNEFMELKRYEDTTIVEKETDRRALEMQNQKKRARKITHAPRETESYHNVFGAGYQPQTAQQTRNYLYTVAGYHPVTGADGKTRYERKIRADGTPEPLEHSWLQEDSYKRIRAMVEKDEIQVAAMDLRDPDRVPAFNKWLKDNNLHVGHYYVSSLLSFADPYLKYDYYSKRHDWEQERQQTQTFFQNLLAASDDRTHFVISDPTADAPFFHAYHLAEKSKADITKEQAKLPMDEPSTEEKKYAVLFSAGGQVWRLAGFMENGTTKYFRIFSEGFPKDKRNLERQIRAINKIIRADKNHAEMQLIHPDKMNPPIEERADSRFFDFERKDPGLPISLSSDPAMPKGYSLVYSSDPFSIRYRGDSQDPADALEILIKAIKEKLGRQQIAFQVEGKRAETSGAQVVTRPLAAQDLLRRSGGTGSVSPNEKNNGR